MQKNLFLAGFDGSTGYNKHGQWFDHVVATGHDRTVEQDYWQLSQIGITASRYCRHQLLLDEPMGVGGSCKCGWNCAASSRRGSATSIVAGACAYRVAPIQIRGHDFGDGAHW